MLRKLLGVFLLMLPFIAILGGLLYAMRDEIKVALTIIGLSIMATVFVVACIVFGTSLLGK